MRLLTKKSALVAAATALLVSCSEQGPTGPVDSSFAIVDARDGGNPGFFWLAPIDKAPPQDDDDFSPGGFNLNLQPRVEICLLDQATDACAPAQPNGFPIVFTSTTGPGSETVRLSEADEHYIVNWHTDDFGLTNDTKYRIQALPSSQASTVLGYADVHVVESGKDLKNVNKNEDIGLKDGRTLPIKFRIENDALCTPGAAFCASAIIPLEDGGSVVVEETGDRVDVPGQGPNTGLPDEILLTVQPCIGFSELPVDLPTFGGCFDITAEPELQIPLPAPALISICSEVDLTGVLDEFQEELVTLHRYDGNAVQALPHTTDNCIEELGRLPGLPGLIQLAKDGLGNIGSRALGLVMPKPLYAGGSFLRRRLDRGRGGATPFFSSFQLALPAEMAIQSGDGQKNNPGDVLPNDPTVFVRDSDGRAVNGATVTFMVPAAGGGGSVTPVQVTTGVNGLASASWTLGPQPGANLLDAKGFGIADPSHGGPFIPDLSLDPSLQSPVTLQLGTVQFTATAQPPQILVGVNKSDDGFSIINFDATAATANLIGPLDPSPGVFERPSSMANASDGTIYVWNNSGSGGANDGVLLTVDACTGLGTRVNSNTPPQDFRISLAMAPDGRLFGMDERLSEIDPATGAFISTTNYNIPMRIGGADYNTDGTLYGAETFLANPSAPDRLVTIDPLTATITVVATLDEDVGVIGSIAFDESGTLFGTGFGGQNGNVFFEIDPTTGAVSNLRPYNGGSPAEGMAFVPTPSCP